jgi:DNA-binding NtrC family response regulator
MGIHDDLQIFVERLLTYYPHRKFYELSASFEAAMIAWAMEKTFDIDRATWSRTEAAKLLGINRTTLVMKIQALGLEDSYSRERVGPKPKPLKTP